MAILSHTSSRLEHDMGKYLGYYVRAAQIFLKVIMLESWRSELALDESAGSRK